MLILTNKPRLFYLNTSTAAAKYKNCLQWNTTSPLNVIKINDKKFDVQLFDKSRTYHFHDDLVGSTRWVDALSQIQSSWAAYLKSQMGAKFNLRLSMLKLTEAVADASAQRSPR